MKKSYIAPDIKAKNIHLSSLITISNGENPINDNPIDDSSNIGAKGNSIFDRAFED